MLLIEELRPLISLFQGTGFIPYTMDLDRTKITGTYYYFSFSLKNLTTWWFAFILISQIITPLVVGRLAANTMTDIFVGEGVPVTVGLLGGFVVISGLVQLALCRWIVFQRFRSLRNAFNLVQDIQLRFGKTYHRRLSSIRKRFIAGFIFSISTVRKSFWFQTK